MEVLHSPYRRRLGGWRWLVPAEQGRPLVFIVTKDDGKQLENSVFLKLNRRRTGMETIAYYQDRGECDFMIAKDETVRRLVQVTWDMSGSDERSRATRRREIDGIIDAAFATWPLHGAQGNAKARPTLDPAA